MRKVETVMSFTQPFTFVLSSSIQQVMISFKMDKQLQTISNYFLFSLAVADFIIGKTLHS